MRIARLLFTIAVLSGFLLPLPAAFAAAPFCVEAQGIRSGCWYYDVKECKAEAAKEHARCSVNPREIAVSGAGGAYCIVDSAKRPVCAYQNWESCEQVASKRIGAICFQNRKKQSSDPYRYDRMPMQPK